MNEAKYLDYLRRLSYRDLQQEVKAISLPSNVKKYHLINMLYKKRYSSLQDLKNYMKDVKLEKKLKSEGNTKRRSSSQNSETSNQAEPSPPRASRSVPSPRIRARDCTANAQCVQIQEVKKAKAVPGSDRVLRSYKKVDYLQMENAVHEILRRSSQVSVVKRKLRVTQLNVTQRSLCDHESAGEGSRLNEQIVRAQSSHADLLRQPALLDLTTTGRGKNQPQYDMTNLRHILNSCKNPVLRSTIPGPAKPLQICVPPLQRAVTVSAMRAPQSETTVRPRYRVTRVGVRQSDGAVDTLNALVCPRNPPLTRRSVYYIMDKPHKNSIIKPKPDSQSLLQTNQIKKVYENKKLVEPKRDTLITKTKGPPSYNISLKDLLDAADVRDDFETKTNNLMMQYPNLSAYTEEIASSTRVINTNLKTQTTKRGLDKEYLDSLSNKSHSFTKIERKKQDGNKKTNGVDKTDGVVYKGIFKISTIGDTATYNYQSLNNNVYWRESQTNNVEKESRDSAAYNSPERSNAGVTPTSESLPTIYTAFSRFQEIFNKDSTSPLHVQVTKDTERVVPVRTNSSSSEMQYEISTHHSANTSILQVATSAHTDTSSTHTVTTADVQEPSLPNFEDISWCGERLRLPPNLSVSPCAQPGPAANVSLDEMFEDAMEIISQDEHYMERLAMEAWCRCVFCSRAGPSQLMESHVRQEHNGLILHRDSNEWSVSHALGYALSGRGGCSSAVQHRGALYLLHTRYHDDSDRICITIYRLSATRRHVAATLTVHSCVTGEALSWSGEVRRYPTHSSTSLSVLISKHLMLQANPDLHITVHVKIFT